MRFCKACFEEPIDRPASAPLQLFATELLIRLPQHKQMIEISVGEMRRVEFCCVQQYRGAMTSSSASALSAFTPASREATLEHIYRTSFSNLETCHVVFDTAENKIDIVISVFVIEHA